MGGFVTNPPPPPATTAPPPAVDVPNAGGLDFTNIVKEVWQGFDWHTAFRVMAPDLLALNVDTHAAKKALNRNVFQEELKALLGVMVKGGTEVGDILVDIAVAILAPFRQIFANLSAHYVQSFAEEMQGGSAGRVTVGEGASIASTAAGAFDSICAPLGFMGGGDPETPGAGHAAVQKVLGSLISLHLNTWVVNVVSNMTGLGFLHYINSFDDVILSAMNTRSMGRLAFKPYMQTYMVDPLTRDLNVAHPMKDPGPGSLVKELNLGRITQAQFLQSMREKGYGPEVAAALLVDVMKHPSVADLAWLVNLGIWTQDVATQELEKDGYEPDMAVAVLQRAIQADGQNIAREIAAEVVDQYAKWEIEREPAEAIIIGLGFPRHEQDLYFQLMDLKHGRHIRPSFAQVKALYLGSMVDLDYVISWLEAEHYTEDDARNIVLLEFAEATTRSAHQAQLGAMYRLRAVTYAQKAQADLAKALDARAAAENTLASKYAALAAKYGG